MNKIHGEKFIQARHTKENYAGKNYARRTKSSNEDVTIEEHEFAMRNAPNEFLAATVHSSTSMELPHALELNSAPSHSFSN